MRWEGVSGDGRDPQRAESVWPGRGPCTASASTSPTASSWSWSARPAAASPRCCACSRAWRTSPRGEIAIGGNVVNTVPPKDRDIAMVFQNYALYPHMTVFDNMAFSLKLAKAPKAVMEQEVERAAKILGLEQLLHRYPAPALGRPAPARRHGPRHRAQSAGLPVRRAALQPRRQAARADARRDQGAAPAAQGHHGLRHARPDRGHDHGRQDRGDEQRQHRAGRPRRSSSTTGRPTCSSRASSARRR